MRRDGHIIPRSSLEEEDEIVNQMGMWSDILSVLYSIRTLTVVIRKVPPQAHFVMCTAWSGIQMRK